MKRDNSHIHPEKKVALTDLEWMEQRHHKGMREHFPEMMLFFCSLGLEGERSAVVLGAERLNVGVEHLLQAYLRPCANKRDELFTSEGALGTFSRKIEVAYRLGLIDLPFKRALNIVRNLRNDFAHATFVETLELQRHADRVTQLRTMMLKSCKGQIEEFELHFMKEGKATKLGCAYLSCIVNLLIKLELTRFLIERPRIRFVVRLDDAESDI